MKTTLQNNECLTRFM